MLEQRSCAFKKKWNDVEEVSIGGRVCLMLFARRHESISEAVLDRAMVSPSLLYRLALGTTPERIALRAGFDERGRGRARQYPLSGLR